mgnify:CR=1 FL=1
MKVSISKEMEPYGLITYLRTDSTRISDEADANVRAYIGEQYGEEYVAVGETKAKDRRQDHPGCA